MPFKTALEAALAHLKSTGIIKRDTDILEPLGIKSKGTVSSYASGKAAMSEGFRTKFENIYGIRLADFEPSTLGAHIDHLSPKSKKNPAHSEQDLQTKYVALLEEQNRYLKDKETQTSQQLRELREYLKTLERNQAMIQSAQRAFQEYWVAHNVPKGQTADNVIEAIDSRAVELVPTYLSEGNQ